MTTDIISLILKPSKIVKLFCIILTISVLTFATDAENVTTIIKKIDIKFSGIASTKKIGTMGIDSMNTFFQTVIKKIPAIENLMRINSAGMVINEISDISEKFKMRNVSEQKWFVHVKTTRTPYYGTNRDTSGAVVFFWSWPIISADSIFNGAISVKIKPSEILKMASVDESTPIALFSNDLAIYKQADSELRTARLDTIQMSLQSTIIIQTKDQTANQPDENSESSVSNDTINSDKTPPAQDTETSEGLTGSTKSDSSTSLSNMESPVVYKSDFLAPAPQKKHAPVAAVILILLSIIFLSSALYIFLRSRNRLSQKCVTLPDITPEELESTRIDIAQMVEEETLAIVDPNHIHDIPDEKKNTDDTNDKNQPVIIDESDDETKSHPPHLFSKSDLVPGTSLIPENIAQELLETTTYEIPPELKIRNAVYKEVHNEVMQWVIAESNRLENRIDELEHRLSIIEKLNTPEIRQVRKDIEDMTHDVNVFRSNMTCDKK